MKTGALIPCRTGSKAIPNKNFRLFNGKPLTQWTIDEAVQSRVFSKIIVSSDGGAGDLLLPENDIGVLDNKRPAEFSTDEAGLDPLLWYYAEQYPDIELWCLLQPTSPLRTKKNIKESYKMIQKKKHDSLVSVTKNPGFLWIDNAMGQNGKNFPISTYHVYRRPNRQDREDWYMENGAIYWCKRYVLEQTKCRLGGAVGLYVMDKEHSLEIDDPIDWIIAEYVGNGRPSWVG